jgi:hypothetical protein
MITKIGLLSLLAFNLLIADGQTASSLLQNYVHVNLKKSESSESPPLTKEMEALDSLRKKALDSIKSSFPYFTYACIGKTTPAKPGALQLDLSLEIVSTSNTRFESAINRVSPGGFSYTIQREVQNGTRGILLQESTEIMKDLKASIQSNEINGLLFNDVYNKLKREINTYVINTREILTPRKTGAVGITVKYNGIVQQGNLSDSDKRIINGLVNNMLVNGQNNFSFNYIPGYTGGGKAGNAAGNNDSLIDLALDIRDMNDYYEVMLNFSSKLPLQYKKYDLTGNKMMEELNRDFKIYKKDLIVKDFSTVVFDISRSMYRFFVLNIPGQGT